MPSKAVQNFVSRSCNRYRQPFRKPVSAMVTFRAICAIQAASGEAVIPAMQIWREANGREHREFYARLNWITLAATNKAIRITAYYD